MKNLIVLWLWYVSTVILGGAEFTSSFKSGNEWQWIQTGEGEFEKFGSWGTIARIDLEGDDRAICKVVEFSGGPLLKPVLTIESSAAVAALKNRLRSEGNWFPVRIGDKGHEGFVRWNFVGHVKAVRENADGEIKGLKLTHLTNRQRLELGTVVDAKLAEKLLDNLQK